ncbi:MAG: DNA polymerase III subunit delta [Anaerovoracaceae bacterium]|jgi:DNA polymerase-3 subunit delta
MAYSSSKEKHAFERIEEDIREGGLKSPLFFYGREQYLVQWAVSVVVDQYVEPAVKDFDYIKIDGVNVTFQKIVNLCETLPILSSKKVILIKDFGLLAGNKINDFTEEDEKDLVEYLSNLPESCILVFTEVTADKRRRLYKAINKYGSCYDFKELSEKQLLGFIAKRLKQSRKYTKPSVIHEWISLSGYYDKESDYTLFNFENDIRKVIAYSESDEIFLEDIKNTVSGNLETFIFSMLDALSERKKGEAFRLLNNLLITGESEFKLLSLICSQLETILTVKELKEEGKSQQEMVNILEIHPYRIKKTILYSDYYSIEQLREALRIAYGIDKKIKSGILDGRLALELLIGAI